MGPDNCLRPMQQASEEGRLREIFGCGTACIVQPVNALIRANGDVIAAPFDASSTSSMTARMTHALTDIQYARHVRHNCALQPAGSLLASSS